MNEVKQFKNGGISLPVRVKETGEIEFDAEQAAKGLGIYQRKNGMTYVRWERVAEYLNSPLVGKGSFISEPDFYRLAIKANNSVAEKFQTWVTNEVLPTIRKHGAYMTDSKIEEVLMDPDTIIKLATQLKTERAGRMIAEQQVKELQPKADYYDQILANKGLVTTTSIAKNYGMSAVRFNQLLHEAGVQYNQSGSWYLYRRYQSHGYTHTVPIPFTHRDGRRDIRPQTKWTQKGHIFIYELLKKSDIVPMIERDGEEATA